MVSTYGDDLVLRAHTASHHVCIMLTMAPKIQRRTGQPKQLRRNDSQKSTHFSWHSNLHEYQSFVRALQWLSIFLGMCKEVCACIHLVDEFWQERATSVCKYWCNFSNTQASMWSCGSGCLLIKQLERGWQADWRDRLVQLWPCPPSQLQERTR